jgi:hypothetical protein
VKLQQIDLSKQYLTSQRILAKQEQLLGFINEEVIPLSGRHHVPKFAIGWVSTTYFTAKKEKSSKEVSAWFRLFG